MATDNFLFLIGAPKCGTTSLARWLDRHEKVVLMPGKEPGYFRTGVKNWVINANRPDIRSSPGPDSTMVNFDAYMAPALSADPDMWILDASTDYLSDAGAANRIKAFSAGRTVKLICVLRDPVERAMSQYRHTIRDGLEVLSFADALQQENQRKVQGYQPLFQHVRRSMYFDDIQRFRALFPDDLMIMSTAEFSDIDQCAQKIYGFTSLPAANLGPMGKENATMQVPRSPAPASQLRRTYRFVKTLITNAATRSAQVRPQITAQDRRLLTELLEHDIRKCVMDPLIPTDDWTCTNSGVPSSASSG